MLPMLWRVTLIVLILSIFSLPILNSQHITHLKKDKFEYESKIYKYSELSSVLENNEQSKIYFDKALKQKELASILGKTSLISLGIGVAALGLCGNGCSLLSVETQTFVGLTLIIFPLAGIAGLSAQISSKNFRRKSIELFNQNNLINRDTQSSAELRVGLLSNGRLGILFEF